MSIATMGNIEALGREVADSGLDAVVAVSPENVSYTAGAFIWTQWSIRDRLALVVIPSHGEPTFIVCAVEEPFARSKSWIRDIRTYVEFKTSPVEVLAEVLKEKGLSSGHVGMEMKYMVAHYYNELLRLMPSARFSPCEGVFDQARMVKTSQEVGLMTRAGLATEKALLATYVTSTPGEAERNLVQRLATNMMHAGADKPMFLYLTVGPNSGFAHPDPTDYRAQVGDVIKTDCGARFSGYLSDVARTAVLGKCTEQQRSIYRRLYQVHMETIAALRVGNRACDVYNAHAEGMKRVDLPFSLPHCGHSIGIAGHETPMLTPWEQTPLRRDMMVCIETRARWPGKEGYHIEDLIRLTDGAPQRLTTFTDIADLMVV